MSQDFSNFQRKEIGLWKAISHKWVSSSAQALPVWAPVSRRSVSANVAGNFLAGALRNPSAAASQTATLFIGIAFAEALGIFAFLTALLLMFAV